MNAIINPAITLNLTSAKIVTEDADVGTISFMINGQPVSLVIPRSQYIYDTVFNVGDRVKIIKAFGAFGLDSEGMINEIIIDSTNDQADILFDRIYPNTVFSADVVEANSGDISVLFRVPLSMIVKI